MVESKAKLKKMLSWSESSDSEDEEDELKAIEKDVLIHRRNLKGICNRLPLRDHSNIT